MKIKIPNLSRLDRHSLDFPGWKLLQNDANDEESFIYESEAALDGDTLNITMIGNTLSGFPFTREQVGIETKIAAIQSRMVSWFSPEAGKTFPYHFSVWYAGSENKTFQMIAEPSSGGKTEDETFKNGENQRSVHLTAPDSNTFTVKVTIKSTDVEIYFEEELEVV